ncbi:34909_t:CDS:2, partial [Gigaspora margarita]
WGKRCLKGNLLPSSQHGKHPSQSFLHDEEVSLKPYLLFGKQKYILITHDEYTFHSYNGTCEFWAPEGKQPLRKKRLRKGLYVSEFLVETIRRLKDEEGEARLIMQFGANHDGYWDGQKLLSQVKNAIEIFEKTHLGYIGVWAFDNATSHKVIVPDTLVAARINLKPGGL